MNGSMASPVSKSCIEAPSDGVLTIDSDDPVAARCGFVLTQGVGLSAVRRRVHGVRTRAATEAHA